MEALLRYLREHHQEPNTTSYEMDTQDYYGSAAAGETSTKPLLRKFISVFRIDGQPIIPPLMTTEKRRQMQKLREKALKVEQRLNERRLRLNNENSDINEDRLSVTSRSSVINTAGSISHRSQDYYDAKLKESEESMMILQDLIRRQSAGEEMMERKSDSFYLDSNFSPSRSNDKLKKLQKSETLIYDNSTNEVIKQIQNLEESSAYMEDQRTQLRELDRRANKNFPQPKKPSHLSLAGLNDGQGMAIPSICINPPTPLVGNRQICEPPSENESNENVFVTETQHIPDDLSSDESFNSMFTHSDDRPPPVPTRKNGIPRSGKMHDLKAYNNASNVTAKIQQFEAISSDHSSPGTTPNASPVKTGARLYNLGASMSRSATSPSIKLNMGTTRPHTALEDSYQTSNDNPLVRSSSFTLEAPSKALIDHMRQQRSISERPSNTGVIKTIAPITSPMNLTRKISSPSRVHRDTIESKAKRVQKVELKPSRQKIQQKTSQHKLAQAAAASMSPHKTNSTSFPTNGGTSNLYKTKKSPYDTPNYTKSPQSVSNNSSAKSSSGQVKKSPPSSVSSVPSQRTSKTKCSPTVDQKPPTSERAALTQMDKMQKDKFLRLLKQQEEEQRKLKQAFEMQQKLLIQQLNKEMGATQISSPPSHSPAMPSSRTSSALTQRSENSNLLHSMLSPDSNQHHRNLEYSQQSLNVSNDSSLNSVATLIPNASVCSQVPSLPISNLSSMDHSNANTSLESSSIFVCDQSTHRPDSVLATPTTPLENGHPVGSGSGNSASRRRLFPHEHIKSSTSPIDGSMRPLNIRSSSNHRLPESQQHQSPKATKGNIALANNANSRRPNDIEVAHAAATTINAYARGFLIRRLFQTEQIQRIVRTMRDTLIFVLNLHMETCQNPAEGNSVANIKLKARLLQQLSSASRTLHLIFFQTSVKERMDIIARDRKRIRTKLLALSRKRYIR